MSASFHAGGVQTGSNQDYTCFGRAALKHPLTTSMVSVRSSCLLPGCQRRIPRPVLGVCSEGVWRLVFVIVVATFGCFNNCTVCVSNLCRWRIILTSMHDPVSQASIRCLHWACIYSCATSVCPFAPSISFKRVHCSCYLEVICAGVVVPLAHARAPHPLDLDQSCGVKIQSTHSCNFNTTTLIQIQQAHSSSSTSSTVQPSTVAAEATQTTPPMNSENKVNPTYDTTATDAALPTTTPTASAIATNPAAKLPSSARTSDTISILI